MNRGRIVNQYDCSGAGCNGTENNGNLRKQEVHIPNNDQGSSETTWYQQYDYDYLNRLKRAHEYTGNTNLDWQQEFDYDRWGNRTINQTNTWGIGIPKPNYGVNTSNNRLTAPTGYALTYDPAGNLETDTYNGAGTRIYDAENRMTQPGPANTQYTYNADGQRVRRRIDGIETWQIYGFDGELMAEYPANGAIANPQKEYGYRNGQLLITAEAPPPANVALGSNGATVAASSSFAGFAASGAINGDRKGLFTWQDGWWSTASAGYPAWLEVTFNGSKTISEIDVFTAQDNYNAPVEPTESMTFSQNGLTGYEVQYWNGAGWVTVTGGSITGNNKVWRKFTFSAITTSKIRVTCTSSPDNYSRLTEVEAWTGPAPARRYDLALGATATASSSWSFGYGASGAVNGDRKSLNWGNGGGWNDAAPANTFPDWLQIDFGSPKTLGEIDVFTLQDNYAGSSEPTEALTFTQWGLTGYDVQYWDGSSWVTVPGGSVTGNNQIWRKIIFSPITTSKIRVLTNASVDGYSRITEVEAYEPEASSLSSSVHWLVTDQLGTPRMVFDESGSLANVSRHDYLPFGEELLVGVSGRTTGQGYGGGDGVRQQFTRKERDNETGLDFFEARYYASIQGRFTSADEFLNDTAPVDPTSWNLYAYVRNNPLRYTDPTGEKVYVGDITNAADRDEFLRRANFTYGCQSCVSVDKDGYLAVNTAGLTSDVLKATQYLTDAINSRTNNFSVEITNNNSEVAFGDSQAGMGKQGGKFGIQLPGDNFRSSAVRIRLDFGDDKWVTGDQGAKEVFLNLVFAHEVAHYAPNFVQDPEDGRKTGPVVDAVNNIQQARGLLLRAEYSASKRSDHFVSMNFGVAKTGRTGILRNKTGGIVVNKTNKIITWIKRSVGGTGIN